MQSLVPGLNIQRPQFTNVQLADFFKISPDAVRRVLKSKWQPSPSEQESRIERWKRRGQRIAAERIKREIFREKATALRRVGYQSDGSKGRYQRSEGSINSTLQLLGRRGRLQDTTYGLDYWRGERQKPTVRRTSQERGDSRPQVLDILATKRHPFQMPELTEYGRSM
jgi:hypothetical protein